MSTILDGAEVTILADLGAGLPFVLDIDQLDLTGRCELTPADDAIADVTAEVVSIDLHWGAAEWTGPLTAVAAGTATITLYDPERIYDPGRLDIAPVVPGRALRVDVDGAPIWTGRVADVTHSLGDELTTVTGTDAVAESATIGVVVDLAAGTTFAQAAQLFAAAGWPAARYRLEGSSSVKRAAEHYVGNLAAGLLRLSDAELGDLYVDRTNVIVMRARATDPMPGHDPILVGDGGVGVVDLLTRVDRVIVNRVVIDMIDPILDRVYHDQPSESAYGVATYQAAAVDLGLV
jgi:hypothetical protein